MAHSKKTRAFLEGGALGLVILLPLIAIGWYLLGGDNDSSDAGASAPSAASQTVSQQPAPATASGAATLVLDDPSALPTSPAAGEIVPFSFTITNAGGNAASFPYKVYVIWNSGEQDVIDENSVTLAAGASKDISESLKFETAAATGIVYLEVQPSGPTIHFAMPRA